MNRTNPYAADATGFSTGETSMTAWVVRVLLSPTKAPETMTATMSVAFDEVKAAMTTRSRASRARVTYRVRGVPKRAWARGATNTAKMATMTPQPVNT